MESTEQTETQSAHSREAEKMSKDALKVFSSGALIIYLAAIVYCFYTGNNLAAALMICALAGVGILAAVTYKNL